MLRMKNFAISIILLSLVALPSTTSSHRQENSPDFSPQRTSLPDTPQRSRGPQSKFVKVQNAIPNRYIVLLKGNEFMQCQSCMRILYHKTLIDE